MPQARQGPDHKQVADLPSPGAPAAAQGDVHIVPEPAGQRDVPPPPELRDAPGDVGIVEVFQKVKAKHPAQADGHVGVGGEIKIDLKGVGNGPQPGEGRRGRRRGKGRVRHFRHRVGQQHLFPQTEQKPHRPGGKFLHALPAGVDLRRHGGVPHDGARHQLGEEGDIQGDLQRILLHGGVAPVHIDHIAQALKGEKGDADGQRHLRHRDDGGKGVEDFAEKSGVFEPAQQPQSQHTCQQHPGFPHPEGMFRPGQTAAGIVDGDGQKHEQQEFRPAAGIKSQGKAQQDQIPQAPHPPGHHKIAHQQTGQEKEQKAGAAEHHGRSPLKYLISLA